MVEGPACGFEGAGDILAALVGAQTGLGGGGAPAANGGEDGDMEVAGDLAGQQEGLIESATPAAGPVERHGDDGVEGLVEGKCGDHKFAEGCGKRWNLLVFEEADEFPEGSLVGAEGVGGVEARVALAAEPAETLIIERVGCFEGSVADRTEELGNQRPQRGKAGGTYRNAGDIGEGDAADAAVVREDEREQAGTGPL